MKRHAIFVDGQEGTTGLRLLDYLGARQDIELLRIADDKRKDSAERARLLNAADVAFLCLPDVAAREAVALVTNPSTCIIDASTAHRTLPDWAYGLPELAPEQRVRLQTSNRIAVPGCHASAFVLLLRPLVDAGLIPRDHAVSAFSLTGYSGGGKKMIAQYEAGGSAKLTSPRPYALGLDHKHLPEMRTHSGLESAPVFNPVVGNFFKGLAVTVPLFPQRLPGKPTRQTLQAALAARYAGERFVRVTALDASDALDEGCFDVQGSNDTNRADLFVFGSDERVALVARLDNLGKGAAGAAVQCLNLRLGCDEAAGLNA
jgi:N-acetyl-gamma-glutamyl-phosphate reductase